MWEPMIDTMMEGGAQLFEDGVKIVTNLFFYKCEVVHIRGEIILNKKIENCEICLYIVSLLQHREKCVANWSFANEYISWRNLIYLWFL